ncbi:MAG: cobalamin biosynthesis protein, partial [Pseudomonadota bacterium]
MGISALWILLLALILDRFVGDPDWLWQRVPHPVVLFGRAIDLVDQQFNRHETSEAQREKLGFISIAVLLIAALVVGWIIATLFTGLGILGAVLEV